MKNYKYLKTLVLIGVILFMGNNCLGQHGQTTRDTESFYWMNVGGGASSFGMATALSLNYQKDKSLFSLKYNYNVEDAFFASISPLLYMRDIGFLYGISSKKGGPAFASIAIGISVLAYNERGKHIRSEGFIFSTTYYEETHKVTMGIPIEAQMFIGGKAIAVGLTAYGNINAQKSYGGLLLCLQLGLLR